MKTFVFFVGIVEFRSMSFSKTPPCVSMPEGQRGHVEQDDVLDLPLEDAALDRRSDRHDLVRVDLAVGLPAEELGDHLLDPRRPGLAADEDDLVDVGGLQAGGLESVEARRRRPVDQVRDERLETVPRQRAVDVLGTGRVGRDERERDRRLARGRQLALRLLGGLLEPLQSHPVLAQVDAGRLLEVVEEPVHDLLVEVFPSEVRVPRRRLDLVDPVSELQDRDVEGPSAQVIDGDDLAPLPLEAVGERRGGRLVDDAEDLESCDPAGVPCRLSLGVVEVRGNGDDRLVDLLAESSSENSLISLRMKAEISSGLYSRFRAADFHVSVDRADDLVRQDLAGVLRLVGLELPPDEPLDGEDRVHGVRDRLPLRDLTDEALAILREAHDRRGRTASFPIREDLGRGPFDDGHATVRRSEVNSEDLAQRPSWRTPAPGSEPLRVDSGPVRVRSF